MKKLSLKNRLVVRGDHDDPSLLVSPESSCHFHVCPRMSADVFRMDDLRFFHVVSIMGSSVQGDIFGFCCISAWNFSVTPSQHRLPTLIFFTEFPFFLCIYIYI